MRSFCSGMIRAKTVVVFVRACHFRIIPTFRKFLAGDDLDEMEAGLPSDGASLPSLDSRP